MTQKTCLCPSLPDLEVRALPAEEVFPASVCPCCAVTPPQPEPDAPCCCKSSMAEALQLLCDPALASLVDFNSFFFLTHSLSVGGALCVPAANDADNITSAGATFHRFSPCNCDLLDVSGTAYFAVPGTSNVALDPVDQLSLCAVEAVAFQLLPSETTEAACCTLDPFPSVSRALRRAIRAEGGTTTACGTCAAHCDCDDCCCTAGILTELSTRNLSRLATLTAGPLVLQDVTVLGSLGSVLVLADEALGRFYLVCANTVETLG